MPTIPRGEDTGRVRFGGAQPIVRQDTSNAGAASGIIADTIRTVSDKRDRFQYAQARSEFLVAKSKEDSAYDNDTDYNSIPTRYQENLDKTVQETASRLSNPLVRQQFMQDIAPTVAEGSERIKSLAFGKERDYQRAYVENKANEIREIAITGSMADAVDAMQVLGESSIEMGYFSAEEFSTFFNNWKNDAAVGAITAAASPEEQIELLDGAIGDRLPSDTRAELRRRAQNQLEANDATSKAAQRTIEAVSIVDSYYAEGLNAADALQRSAGIADAQQRRAVEARIVETTNQRQALAADVRAREATDIAGRLLSLNPADATQAITNIEDPELQRAVRSEYSTQRQVQRVAEQETQDELFTTYYTSVEAGEITSVDDIPPNEWAQLTPATKESVRQLIARQQTGAPSESDLVTVDTLNQMLATAKRTGDYVAVREYYVANAARLNSTDAKAWSEVTVNGVVSPEGDSALTAMQYMDEKLTQVFGAPNSTARRTAADDRRAAIRLQYTEWYNAQTAQGIKPTPEQMTTMADRLFLELPTSSRGTYTLFDGNARVLTNPRRLFEMNDVERGRALGIIKRDAPQVYQDVLFAMGVTSEQDPRFNPELFAELYNERMNRGR